MTTNTDPTDTDPFARTLSDRLATELTAADLQPWSPEELLTEGHRRLRRRRTGQGMAAAAVAAVLAVGGYAVWSPSDVHRPTPPASASPTAHKPVTAILDELPQIGEDPQDYAAPGEWIQYAVTWHPTPNRNGQNLDYARVARDESVSPLAGSSTVGMSPDAVTWGTSGPESRSIVGVLPARATDFTIVRPQDVGGSFTSTRAALPGSPWQAFAARFSTAKAVESITDILWWDDAEVIRTAQGEVVPSVSLGDGDNTQVYVAAADDTFGVRWEGGAASTWLSERGDHPVIDTFKESDTASTGIFVMLVPPGSHDPQLTPKAGVRGVQAVITDIPGSEYAALWTRYTRSSTRSGQTFTSISWTGPDGKRTTQQTY